MKSPSLVLSCSVQVSQFSTTILSAMLAGMDDREDPDDLITMEAMSGLARIFQQIDEGHVRPILINIALRIRPCFEKVFSVIPIENFINYSRSLLLL